MSDAQSDARIDQMRMERWEREEARKREELQRFVESLVSYVVAPRKRGARQRMIDCAQSIAVKDDHRWKKYAVTVEPVLQRMRQRDAKEIARLLVDLLETVGPIGTWYNSVRAVAPIEVTRVLKSVDQTMLLSNIQSETIHRLKKLL